MLRYSNQPSLGHDCHMSGHDELGVSQRRRSTVSRAQCAGAVVLLEDTHVPNNAADRWHWQQLLRQHLVWIILSK